MKYTGFHDLGQMRSYLRRCIIRVGKEPVYVEEVMTGRNTVGNHIYKIHYRKLGPGENIRTVSLKSKRVNFAPVPLGFVNIENDCLILSRRPARMWKIGLSENNMDLSPVAGKTRVNWSYADVIHSTGLRDTILGDFPTYKSALATVNDSELYTTIAFDRHFAIQKKKKSLSLIYYKFDLTVGRCNKERPRLHTGYGFLKEHLDGVI